MALTVVTALGSCTLGGRTGDARVVAYFRDVGDLVTGAQVQVNDIEVGSVRDIKLQFEEGRMLARVTMSLDEDIEIASEGLSALVRQTSLLGEQFVQLVPASSDPPFLGSGEVVVPATRTDRRVDVETFLADLTGLVAGGGLEDLNRFTHAQALILEDRGRRFGETIVELERLTSVLAGRRSDIGAAIESLGSAATTLADNRATLDSFLDSLDDANALLADQGDELSRLFAALDRFGRVNARFLARHEDAINRQFRSLRPIFDALADTQAELRTDIAQLRTFLELFPRSFGGGPSDRGRGDYVQIEAVVCEDLANCHTRGEKGDVKGQGS
jgi:phospholipid/cholesterol/gamma-HCH transport system substrate-binding protein